MIQTHSRIIGIYFIVLVFSGCIYRETGDEIDLPGHIGQFENFTVFPLHSQNPDTVELIRKVVFESNDDVFLPGYIGSKVVDGTDRVYISSGNPDRLGIYVFSPDGSYLTTIGRFGQGPGEFESITSMEVWNNHLYVLDSRLQKFASFSLDSFELTGEAIINRRHAGESDDLVHLLRAQTLHVTDDGNMLLRLGMLSRYPESDINRIVYYRLSRDGTIIPDAVLEVERFPFYFPGNTGNLEFPITMPFTRSSFVAITEDGRFFTAWAEDFLVKVYDKDGNYRRTFYYPVEKSRLSINELELNRDRQGVLNQYNIPETWPALHTMELDNEGRLWVAAITDSDSTFTWYVLNQQGDLLARFTLPGRRATRSVMANPLILIHNGYFYTREQDLHAGIDRIVKHRIKFKKR